jgi:hypothetical protein
MPAVVENIGILGLETSSGFAQSAIFTNLLNLFSLWWFLHMCR